MEVALSDWPELTADAPAWLSADAPGPAAASTTDELDAAFLHAAFGVATHGTPTSALRCVDEHHSLDCVRCTPPPAPDEVDQYLLRKDRGALLRAPPAAFTVAGARTTCLGLGISGSFWDS